MKHKLFLETLSNCYAAKNKIYNVPKDVIVTLDTFISLFVLKFTGLSQNIHIYLVSDDDENQNNKSTSSSSGICVDTSSFEYDILSKADFKTEVAGNCDFPVMLNDGNVVLAGLCAVCRNIVKSSDEKFIGLLGFKSACLLAPAEASIWTKFCEVDIIESTKKILKSMESANSEKVFLLPDTYSRFESHMSQPIRAHNIYKLARELAKASISDISDEKSKKKYDKIASSIPIKDLNLEHKYAEGQEISIADLILYPCFWLAWTVATNGEQMDREHSLSTLLPLTYKWLMNINREYEEKLMHCLSFIQLDRMFQNKRQINNFDVIKSENVSLYKSDPKRYKPSNRIFTKQQDIENALCKVSKLELNISSANQSTNTEHFDWDSMPFEALPEGGQLPKERLLRKKNQLEGIAKQVMRIVKNGDRIVDFCSGTGHLGILLAYKLPKCQVYLLENKEESLNRAQQRVRSLNLSNVLFFQCNLDYFVGDFDIGLSLHACGVATDIVLKHCIERHAKFVCCPCCYGGCHQMPHISYPRSEMYKSNNITAQDYMHIAHCADQAHDISKPCNVEKSVQGGFCMDVVDTDRKILAEEHGYTVLLTRLYPEDCTPKNRLLVGVI